MLPSLRRSAHLPQPRGALQQRCPDAAREAVTEHLRESLEDLLSGVQPELRIPMPVCRPEGRSHAQTEPAGHRCRCPEPARLQAVSRPVRHLLPMQYQSDSEPASDQGTPYRQLQLNPITALAHPAREPQSNQQQPPPLQLGVYFQGRRQLPELRQYSL